MAQKKKGSKAEAIRRKEQANRDKKKASSSARSGSRTVARTKPQKKNKAPNVGVSKYAALVLNPCHADFAMTNLPGSGGSQLVRVPIRTSYYLPAAGVNASGAAASGISACDSGGVILAPHAMVPGSGPASVTTFSAGNETGTPATAGGYGALYDSPGLSSLQSFAGYMRPVAACIRISCYSPESQNSGMFFGYEGSAKGIVLNTTAGDKTSYFTLGQTVQNVIFNGMTTGDTFSTYEVRINYPAADSNWQTFRDMSRVAQASGVYDSADAADLDPSDMPVAVVGITGGTPGTRYLLDGAIVYEWQPKLAIGISAPKHQATASSTMLAQTGKLVQQVANKWGGMLISSAVNYATGGGSGAVLALARQSYAASIQASKVPRLGWN